jgi:hypothetical protein
MALTAKKVYAILKRQISDMEAKLNSPVRYRGTVATADLLPLNPDIGDMYNIESKSVYGEAGMNVAWNGVVWDTMGAPIDMSLYLTKEEAETVIQRLVTEYFEKNPVKPGATTEQAQQIEQNKTDIASLKKETGSLKEDISTKITKFYASSQGENYLADSDNGKIMDMMLYGKSEQKQYSGKNLLNVTFKTDTYSGVTLTNNGDGTYTIEGTNNSSGELIFSLVRTVDEQKALYNSLIGKKVKFITESGSTISGSVGRICFVLYNETEKKYSNETYNGGDVAVPTGYDLSVVDIHIYVGQTVPKTIIKPMITTDLTATYDDFEPYTGGKPSPSPDYPQEIKSVVNPIVKVANKDGTQFKTATLPYTLNAIPVSSGGNVTIDGQQYIADYVDVERGKLVKKIKEISKDPIVLVRPTNNPSKKRFILGNKFLKAADNFNKWSCKCSNLQTLGVGTSASYGCVESCGIDTGGDLFVYYEETSEFTTAEEFKAWWGKRDIQLMGILETPIEIDLTSEEIAAFKALVTYYPTTNISVNSEQLDGYIIFNYPISMENGWNYVKQQIGDTRDYIYDMDARAQDTDLQAAEAYVNSEYAVALTELEV